MLGEDERKVKEKANERKKERNDNSKQLMGFSMTSNWFQQEIDGYFHSREFSYTNTFLRRD